MLLREHGKDRYAYRDDTVMQKLNSTDNGNIAVVHRMPAGQQ